MPRPVYSAKRQVWRDGGASTGTRQIPEETPLALTYNGGTYAVMMGTPHDLGDFAVGFSLSEGIVQSPDEIETFDIVEVDDGIELRMWLTPSSAGASVSGWVTSPSTVMAPVPDSRCSESHVRTIARTSRPWARSCRTISTPM